LRPSLKILTVLVSAAVLLAASSASFAYSTTGGKWPQPGVCGFDCPGTPLTLTYSFQNMFDGGLKMPDGNPLPNSLIRGSIEEALGLWSSVVPISFMEVPDDGLNYGQSTQHGQLRFRHIYINGPDPPPPADPVAKAQAYYPPGVQAAGDVEFDHGDPWQASGIQSIPDILGAATHEIGHALGLGHSDIPGVNMYWIFHRFQGLGTGQLYPDDITGIRTIYGTGSGIVISLVPEPSSLMLLLSMIAGCSLRRRRR
jgi:hypothetical protein